MTGLEYSWMWLRALLSTEAWERLLESFSKLVERREVVKLYLDHKLARFFAVESRVLACALASMHVHSIRGYGYMRLPEIDSWAGASLATRVSLALVCQVACELYCKLLFCSRWRFGVARGVLNEAVLWIMSISLRAEGVLEHLQVLSFIVGSSYHDHVHQSAIWAGCLIYADYWGAMLEERCVTIPQASCLHIQWSTSTTLAHLCTATHSEHAHYITKWHIRHTQLYQCTMHTLRATAPHANEFILKLRWEIKAAFLSPSDHYL